MEARQSTTTADGKACGASERATSAIRGTAASRGRWVGRARLAHAGFSPESLRGGEVLVSQMLPPGLSLLLVRAGALVMESGGTLSSQATLARELGIPAVLGAADATTLIREGQLLAVDGDLGTVRLIPPY